jgi:hypothetical protein
LTRKRYSWWRGWGGGSIGVRPVEGERTMRQKDVADAFDLLFGEVAVALRGAGHILEHRGVVIGGRWRRR